MVKLSGILNELKLVKVLVIGDFMLDLYTYGDMSRISPEAPVGVLKASHMNSLPGGAGNVALNLSALGAEVILTGRIGEDDHGSNLLKIFEGYGIDTKGLIKDAHFPTIVKNRLIADGQQLIRIDLEKTHALHQDVYEKACKHIEMVIPEVDIVAISDYGKGFLSNKLLTKMIKVAHKHKKKVIVDPKGVDFTKYAHADLIKPNLKEAFTAANCEYDADLSDVANVILDKTQAKTLLITRSADGMSLFTKDGRRDFPVRVKEVNDVTGAGDTALAMLTYALANHVDLPAAIHLSNIASGIAVEKLGCACVTLQEVAGRIFELDHNSKIFNEDHLYTLSKYLEDHIADIVCLKSQSHDLLALFKAIKSLESEDRSLILYIEDSCFDEDFLDFLSSLREVDFIIIQTENLSHLLKKLNSHQVYYFDGKQLCIDNSNLLLTNT